MKNNLLLIILIWFVACTKERPQLKMPSPILPKTYSKVFVINEGIFPNDNSSITLYDETQGIVSDNYFKYKNPSAILGSVPQSIAKINDKYYVVVNNASKVIVLDSNFIKVSEISNLLSPRYVLGLPNNIAYVSDYISNNIHVINTVSNTKIGSISCPGWTEQMLLLNGKVYITNYKKNQLYIINPANNLMIDSVSINKGADAIVKDMNNNLWVLCTSIYNYEHKYLYCINTTNNSIIKTFEFAVSENPSQLCINKNGNTLYYINKGVYKLSINDAVLPTTPIIDGSNPKIFYGLGVNPSNENIYVSDSKAGQNYSKIYVYKSTGVLLTSFDAGYFAGEFFFDK